MPKSHPHWKSLVRSQIPTTFQLAWPLVLGQLGQMTMILIDTFMIGLLGPEFLGGVGLGSSLFWVLSLFGVGTLLGLDYLVSYAHGKGSLQECHHWLWQGVYLSLILSVPLVCVMELGAPVLFSRAFSREIAVPALEFLQALAWSLGPYLVFVAFREYLQAMGSVRPGTVVTVCAILSNIFFNWLLIFGHWGVRSLGVAGAGWATTVTRVLMALSLVAYTFYRDRRLRLGLLRNTKRLQLQAVGRLFRLGAPAGFQFALETGVFSLAAVLMSKLGVVEAASHTIVVNIATFTYMVPLGLSGATAVLVGNQMGNGEPREAKVVGWTSIGIGVGVMAVSGILLCALGGRIVGFFTRDPGVIRLSSELILLVALFQIADGAQSVGSGALRGLGDTRSSFLANLIGYWGVGIPLGYFCAFWLGLNAIGVWIGLTVGLFAVAGAILAHWHLSSRLY